MDGDVVEQVKPLKARRQLGVELRAARTLVGKTQRDLAAALGTNQPRVLRAEHGDTLLTRAEVVQWLDATDAGQDVHDRVLVLVDGAHTETWPWRDGMAGGHLQGAAAVDEQAAVRIRNYAMQWMPGLVQTGAYAQALLAQLGGQDTPAAVAARLERQAILFEPGRRFELLFEESALLWSPAVGVMPAQLDRLLSVASLDAVEVAVLPTARVGASGWAPFMLWTDAEDAVAVTTELPNGEQVESSPDGVAAFEAVWSELWAAAHIGNAALDFIRQRSA